MKNKKFIIIAVIVIVGLAYWFIIRPKMQAKKNAGLESESSSNSNSSFSSGYSDGSLASTGKEETKKIQMAVNRVLSKQGKTTLVVDGAYGPLTKQAVKSVVGKEIATYTETKTAVITWFESNGYGNPYASSSTGNNSANQSNEDFNIFDQWFQWGGIDGNLTTPW